MGKKTSVLNRDNIKLAVQIDKPNVKPKGTAFLAHGLGGFMEQKIIHNFMDVFLEKGYQTVRWDAANTIGESGGKMEEVTPTSYIYDLEDVLNWAKEQVWYIEPTILCGHSLGGISSLIYSEKYPSNIDGVFAVASVVSGKLDHEIFGKETLEEWKKVGFFDRISNSKPGTVIRTQWKYAEDILKYDAVKNANKLTMSINIIVGDKDIHTPLTHQEILFKALPTGNKWLHIVPGAYHSFRTEEESEGLKKALADSIYNFETANS